MKNYTVKTLPVEERPQERLFTQGVKALSNAELIALIIRTGTRDKTVMELAQNLLAKLEEKSVNVDGDIDNGALIQLKNATYEDIKDINGIGPSKAAMILAAVELGKRINDSSPFRKIQINNPEKIFDFLKNDMGSLLVEEFRIAILDTKKYLERIVTVSKGTMDRCDVHPRDVFKHVVADSAHSIILIHNHPTGDPKPSQEDIKLTKRLVEAGDILGIQVIDHIIIAGNKYVSLAREGYI